jgi:AraC-like DNA-binding protein
MQYLMQKPAQPLADYIDHIWWWKGVDSLHNRESVLPDGSMELIIDLDDSPKHIFSDGDAPPVQSCRQTWLSGIQPSALIIGAAKGGEMIGAHFKPGGAYPFFEMPMEELAAQVIPVDLLWGIDILALRDRLLNTRSGPEKLNVFGEYLLRRFSGNDVRDRLIAIALRYPVMSGEFRATDLAKWLGMSQRRMLRRFQRQVGLTPKLVHRITRFQQVISTSMASRQNSWGALAADCGYYDQSHLIRDFRQFAGMTPTQFERRRADAPNFVPLDP